MATEPKSGLLQYISPSDILPNKENPRLIFNEDDLQYLRESIKEVGILVPLTVYKRSLDGKYVLLDGERRWRCAKDLGLEKVPCNRIEEPNQIENILRMFNIHNTRKEWELVPTALKLQTLIRLLGEKPNSELARLSGMSSARVNDCKKVLSFPKKYLDLALFSKEGEDKITGDFFALLYSFLNEAEKVPEIARHFSRDEMTDFIIRKYRKGTVAAMLDLRVLKKALVDARKYDVERSHVANVTSKFLESETMSPEEYYDATTGSLYGISKVVRSIERLKLTLRKVDKDQTNNRMFRGALRELRAVIEELLT